MAPDSSSAQAILLIKNGVLFVPNILAFIRVNEIILRESVRFQEDINSGQSARLEIRAASEEGGLRAPAVPSPCVLSTGKRRIN